RDREPPQWCENAMRLFEIADEASEGVGFISDFNSTDSNRNVIAQNVCVNQQLAYYFEHEDRRERVANIENIEWDYREVRACMEARVSSLQAPTNAEYARALPNLPYSICDAVPTYVACVQPKANTPQVGYSLRSLSHNLALLPRVGEVSTFWFNAFGPRPNH